MSEPVWQALLALIAALPQEDFRAAAAALLSMGATGEQIDVDALARDFEALYRASMQGVPVPGSGTIDASADNTLLQLGEIGRRYGIRFPRAFTLLLKQFLYFDRFIDALAPDLDLLRDARIVG